MTKTEDESLEIIRGKGTKKREPFHFCLWAPGAWEAEFYAHTELHEESRARTIRILLNDVAWNTTLNKVHTDTRKMKNKIEGTRRPRRSKKKENNDD